MNSGFLLLTQNKEKSDGSQHEKNISPKDLTSSSMVFY